MATATAIAAFSAMPLVLPGVAQCETRRITTDDLRLEVGLSSPALSPDGSWIAVVVSRPDYEENRFARSLVLVDAATGAQRPVPTGSSSAFHPLWSPTGRQLAWLSSDGGPPQIYSLSMESEAARPVRLTNVATGVQSFAWRPDGGAIAFLSPEPPPVRQGEERNNRSFEVVDNDALATEAPGSSHLWLISVAGGEPQGLTAGPESVTELAWLRSGRALAFASQPRPHNSPTDYAEFMHLSSRSTALKTIDLDTRAQHMAVPDAGIISAPRPSASGDLIAYLSFRGPERWTHPQQVALLTASTGAVREVTAALDQDVQEFAWLPRGDALLVTAPGGTRVGLWVQPLQGSAREVALGPVVDVRGLSVSDSGSVAFVGKEATHPAEIYVLPSLGAKPRRLTSFNQELALRAMGRTETVKWRNDAFDESGVVTYPPDFKAGQKVPLVLYIHGGPNITSTEAFDVLNQILAAQGWAVFNPNYRGSNSQGDAFQSAVINDLGDGPGRDVMAGVAALKARGFVDESRMAVSGWSYGGYMTAWLIGHFQVWRAAVAGAPLANYLDWYNTSCCNSWADPVLGGSPWLHGNVAHYWEQSPVAYVGRTRTPTLVLGHLHDPEVPLSQSYNLYHALRDNGVPVRFVVYPVEGHNMNIDPVHQRDTYRRWVGWIDEHFRAPPEGAH
jgi:dipeptidyl aminopeptidase/acylaminoacyl peptidase